MKRLLWSSACAVLLLSMTVWAAHAWQEARQPTLPEFLPEGALLYVEAKDFGSLLKGWDSSQEKKVWLTSSNHEVFSNSRLFTRLSQARDEFSAAAGVPTDHSLLGKVAGKESCLGLYDIGNLEFVYMTRLEQQDVEASPLWQVRSKFEQRTEGGEGGAGAQFFVHHDAQSHRTAAFAAKDGWLILGTREDLVAGVLDRLHRTTSHSLSDAGWFADAVKLASAPQGDLRMVMNLDKIVATPYFRSYWVQRNVTEMKQYSAAVSDLYLTGESYREERVLVRGTALAAGAEGDVQTLAALAPEDAVFYSAQESSTPERLLQRLRDDLLELKTDQVQTNAFAPSLAVSENAGNAALLDVRIDQAPVTVQEADAYALLRAVLGVAQPDAVLEVYAKGASQDGVFVSLPTAMVISAAQGWHVEAVQEALTAGLLPGLTAARLGAGWEKRQSPAGEYLALDGQVSLYAAILGKDLVLSNDTSLLEGIMQRRQNSAPPKKQGDVTYAAVFRHTQEQGRYRTLTATLDGAGHRGHADGANPQQGENPAFFSGNVASLSRVLSNVAIESVVEKDLGTKVTETVTYQWKH